MSSELISMPAKNCCNDCLYYMSMTLLISGWVHHQNVETLYLIYHPCDMLCSQNNIVKKGSPIVSSHDKSRYCLKLLWNNNIFVIATKSYKENNTWRYTYGHLHSVHITSCFQNCRVFVKLNQTFFLANPFEDP